MPNRELQNQQDEAVIDSNPLCRMEIKMTALDSNNCAENEFRFAQDTVWLLE